MSLLDIMNPYKDNDGKSTPAHSNIYQFLLLVSIKRVVACS